MRAWNKGCSRRQGLSDMFMEVKLLPRSRWTPISRPSSCSLCPDHNCSRPQPVVLIQYCSEHFHLIAPDDVFYCLIISRQAVLPAMYLVRADPFLGLISLHGRLYERIEICYHSYQSIPLLEPLYANTSAQISVSWSHVGS